MPRPIFHTVRWLCFLLVVCLIGSTACSKRTFSDRHTDSEGSSDSTNAVNINTADRTQLENLTGVGPSLADKIIEHRSRYGPFRRTEHVMLVEGVSAKRFLKIRPYIKVD